MRRAVRGPALPAMAAGVKGLLRLYPRSWRKRFGPEMEVLVEETPGGVGIALDLVAGAAVAYRDVIRANRILSSAGAYLHGICVAVLLQAIVFVTLVLAGQGSAEPTNLSAGPFVFVTVVGIGPRSPDEIRALGGQVMWIGQMRSWIPEAVLIVGLVGLLALVLAAPRFVRALR